MARCRRGRVCGLDARAAAVIRIDSVWLAAEPLDMRAGTETALSRVVQVFGSARPHHAYLFANRRANRMKVLVHDGMASDYARAGCIKDASSGPTPPWGSTWLLRASNSMRSCSGCLGSAWAMRAPSPWRERVLIASRDWGVCE